MPLAVIILAGCLNALLLALVLVAHPRLRQSSATHYLAGMLGLAAVVIGLITLEHADLVWPTPFLLWLEESLSLLVGPLLAGYVTQAVRGRHPPAWLYLPWLLHLVAFLVLAEDLRSWVRIEHVIWIQMGYTLFAVTVWARAASRPRHVLLMLTIFLTIHAAQLVRFSWIDVGWLEDIVPWVATLSFFGLMAYATFQSRALAGLVSPPMVAAQREAYSAVEQRLAAVMQCEKPWQDSGLTLERLASMVECAPTELSAVLNRHLGKTFYDYLNQHRVAEAARLLANPAERRYSVHGIGLQAGFGSRSGFYKIFKAHTGLSPAEYRRACPSE